MDRKTLINHINSSLPKNHTGRLHALMLFFTEVELGYSNTPNKWVNTSNSVYFNGIDALNAYANTRCPASQLVEGDTPEELADNMIQMVHNFNNEAWLETELYPYM